MTDSEYHRNRIFYGWWIVIACLLIAAFSSGVISHGFTAIFEPIAEEFSWSYTQVSVAASIRGIEGSILAPIAGLFFTRLGARKIIFTGVAVIGLSLLILSRINSLWMFYITFMLAALGLSAVVGVVPMSVVGNWFRKNVALATGIVVCGSAFGGLMLPLVTKIVDTFGWREAMVIIGIGALGIFLPISLIVRQKPEQYGYLPDGKLSIEKTSAEVAESSQNTEVEIGIRQALKSRTFWQLSSGLACCFTLIMTVITHVMPYLSTIGFTRSTSSFIASALPLTSISSRLGFGWLGDRFNKKMLLVISCFLMGLSLLLFSFINVLAAWLIVPFIILFSVGWGGVVPMHPALFREYFGRDSLSALLGFSMGLAYSVSIAGPPMAGWVFDNYGSYFYAWIALAGVAFVALILFLTSPSVGGSKRIANRL
jgi:sugar phosphate permease